MGIFDTITEVQVGAHTLQFRQPKLAEIERARALSIEFNASPDAAAVDRILYADIPALIEPLLCGAAVAGGAELPADWREQVIDSPYLSGASGLQILQAVFFRSYVSAA